MLPSLSRVIPHGLVELAIAVADRAAFSDKLPVWGEDLQTVVAAVGNNDVAVFLDRGASTPRRRCLLCAISAGSCRCCRTRRWCFSSHRRRRRGRCCRRQPRRARSLPVAFAVFAKISDMFFFAETADVHLVDVHPEIILVASIGGVEIAVFIETHCLDVIETRAAGGVYARWHGSNRRLALPGSC